MKKTLLLSFILFVFTGCNAVIEEDTSDDIFEGVEFEDIEEKEVIDKLVYLEIRSLLDKCADLTWDTDPSPEDPGEAIVYINKCIHQ